MSLLLRLERQITDFLKSTSNSYVFLSIHLELKRKIRSYTPVPYPIPDQNGQNVYPFSDQKAQKPYPLGRHMPIMVLMAYIRELVFPRVFFTPQISTSSRVSHT